MPPQRPGRGNRIQILMWILRENSSGGTCAGGARCCTLRRRLPCAGRRHGGRWQTRCAWRWASRRACRRWRPRSRPSSTATSNPGARAPRGASAAPGTLGRSRQPGAPPPHAQAPGPRMCCPCSPSVQAWQSLPGARISNAGLPARLPPGAGMTRMPHVLFHATASPTHLPMRSRARARSRLTRPAAVQQRAAGLVRRTARCGHGPRAAPDARQRGLPHRRDWCAQCARVCALTRGVIEAAREGWQRLPGAGGASGLCRACAQCSPASLVSGAAHRRASHLSLGLRGARHLFLHGAGDDPPRAVRPEGRRVQLGRAAGGGAHAAGAVRGPVPDARPGAPAAPREGPEAAMLLPCQAGRL